MLRAFLARRRDAKTRKLVGIQTFKGRAFNPVTQTQVPWSATAKLFMTEAGVRSVEVSDPDLMKEAVVIAWLEWGQTPHGMVRCA
ncbi:hypothetical protein DOMOVOI_02840 [Brevundimonas phage vB_BpoS-Domovoi]|uniref:Uncharacterized protein n=1 Tax=Brevundimonas phage vB_BpoS-Domovoi TaxID=2948598 RepID=A0A9E7MQZ9_9CAUD|nr:hypothetical protein DOMOVOI_02840 [Brevundimonas phage vB_BpoS-Domovoi]